MRSASGQLLWAAGTNALPELWRFAPGEAEPELIFVSPREDAVITDVVGAKTGYTFAETSREAFGDGGWRIWFLSGPGAEPIELDRGEAPGAGATPTIAMDDDRIAWAAFDEPDGGPVSRLRVVNIDALSDVTTLIDQPIGEGLLWFPQLNGDELWYAVIHAEATDTGDEFHIETRDISAVNGGSTRFSGMGNDFNPAVNDRFVVWKTAEGDSAALNWGTLHVLNRLTNTVSVIPVPNANRPSIGDRFITFDEITHTRLAIYEPATGELYDLVDPNAQAEGSVGSQSVAGRLLGFFLHETGMPRIGWAILPE